MNCACLFTDERVEDERLGNVGCIKQEDTKSKRLLTGTYEREGKKENYWEGGRVSGTLGYPGPRRWDASRRWKRTDNNK